MKILRLDCVALEAPLRSTTRYATLDNKCTTGGSRTGLLLHPTKKDASAGPRADHWAVEPASWAGIPEEKVLSEETLHLIRQAIDGLPEGQRAVITLHDIEEFSSQEICNILEISETNQRVLLHRARARVREALENYLQPEIDG